MLEMPENLHTMTDAEADALCAALRARLVEVTSRNGGHLASNLGVVELTVALHRVFTPQRDRILFDVGHQCYCHKMLTGRDGAMETLRVFGGLSGFPKPRESETDAFIAGHASAAVSTAVGMARARTLMGENYKVIAVLGDGALTGGLAYEGLSDAGGSGEPLLVILNDNGMSITRSVGGVADHVAKQRLKPQYLTFKKNYRRIFKATSLGRRLYRFNHTVKTAVKEALLPCSMFEDMGFTYLGPVDGHDVKGLTRILSYAKDLEGPVLLHVRTVKGKGYAPAEAEPDVFHGVGRFDPATGEVPSSSQKNYSQVFGETLCELAEKNDRVAAVTAAMSPGTGLDAFARRFPQRFFDVGIAEGHAVTMCAGMAKQGMTPVFAVYSTFLQRSYDMLLHDVALQGLHVVLCVDRAGLVGEDGETHHGIFDVGFLDTIPGMTVLCPSDYAELRDMLDYAVNVLRGPVALRYPRGCEGSFHGTPRREKAILLREGTDVTLVGYGPQIDALLEAADRLAEENVSAEVVKLNTITPLDTELVLNSAKKTGRLLAAEECAAAGSVGERLSAAVAKAGMETGITLVNLGTGFPPQGSVAQLRRLYGLDGAGILERALEVCGHDEKATGRCAV